MKEEDKKKLKAVQSCEVEMPLRKRL